jgi:very-short-patch-repair endonuclease
MNGDHGATADRRVDIEEAIMSLASRQHGVVARAQLLVAGVSPDVVNRRVKGKRLLPVHRGVYLVGPVRAPYAREMAAVLACGGASMLSHWSAAVLWQLEPHRARPDPVEVSAAGGAHPRIPGIRVHRVRSLAADEATEFEGIPITTPARTICDLAGLAAQRELEHALAEALGRGLTDRDELLAVSARCSRRPGIGTLRTLLAKETEPELTRSNAERHLFDLIGQAQLPKPAANTSVLGHRGDFHWPSERFVLEVDGFAFHSSSQRFEKDRRRDAELAAAGVRVMRVTWRQLVHEPMAVIARLAQALVRPARE